MILAIQKNDISELYGQLLTFKEIIRKMSEIIEEEVSPSADNHLKGVREKNNK